MARYDFSTRRLFLDADLAAGSRIALDRMQTNYLCTVLRLVDGAELLVFNGRDGEWTARLSRDKRTAHLTAGQQTRQQPPAPDLEYLFAPLKQARLDYMVQKAVEMGVGRLSPILTQHGQVSRLNADRMRANVIEAAEQCGILAPPTIAAPEALAAVLDRWPAERILVFCDEDAPGTDPVATLRNAQERSAVSLLIGPEGGWSSAERERLLSTRGMIRISLGPRILRADTAAVAALTLIQTAIGDWIDKAT
jgi:16S rRNA (uracil1498-N3)-methyltransferase